MSRIVRSENTEELGNNKESKLTLPPEQDLTSMVYIYTGN
jgi:hypothetical protein